MKPMTNPLRRINRAKKHLNVLNREIKAFIASKPYRCDLKRDPKDGSNIFCPYLVDGYPITWGLLIGEVAHGLRSALDNIAWSLAIKPDTRTVFPIYLEESPEFINKLKNLREDIWADVKAVQPYNAPNGEERRHQLWILRIVDNIDKHRIILPGAIRVSITTGLPSPNRFFYIDGFKRLNKGDLEFKLTPPFNHNRDFKPEIVGQIGFDISSPPTHPDDSPRIRLADLFLIHDFVRNDVYPRFAKLLEPEDSLS